MSDGLPPSAEIPVRGAGLTWEEMEPGSIFRTPSRTITETDLMTFVHLGGFNEPLFYDSSHAGAGGYRGRLVPGALVYTIGEGLVIQSGIIHGTGLAFLSMEVKVLGPTYVGDTVHAVHEVLSTRPTSKPGRGIVESRVTVRNQRGEDVLVFTPTRMIRGKDYVETTPSSH